MSTLHKSGLGDLTRGGQTTLHFLRMLGQVLAKFAGIIFMGYALVAAALFLGQTTGYERSVTLRFVVAWASTEYMGNAAAPAALPTPSGGTIKATQGQIYRSSQVRALAYDLFIGWVRAMIISFVIMLAVLLIVLRFIWRSGAKQRDELHLRGGEILESKELERYLKRVEKAGELRIAGIPMLVGSETMGIMLVGAPGTGKSTTIYELMTKIRALGHRCICFSPSGDFIEWFYREGTDTILNPFDERSPSWNLWSECAEDYHYAMIAEALIPDGEHGEVWNPAARTLVRCLLARLHESGECSAVRLLEMLTQVPLEQLYEFIADTEAASLVDPVNERTAMSVRMTAATFASSLRYIPDRAPTFPIRDWVLKDDGESWVFLNARSDQIASARSLLSAQLEVFTNSLLSLPPNRDRRIWLIIDELPKLNRIPSLQTFAAEGRKYGGCGVLAFQQITQLRDRYGKDGAATLAGMCATWVAMRQNEVDSADWLAKNFGEVEVIEQNEGLSYGAHEIRDGVTLTQNRKMRQLLLGSQILYLDNLEGYLRLPGALPVGHFKLPTGAFERVAPAYVPRARAAPAEPPLAGAGEDALVYDLPDVPAEDEAVSPARRYAQMTPVAGEAPALRPGADLFETD